MTLAVPARERASKAGTRCVATLTMFTMLAAFGASAWAAPAEPAGDPGAAQAAVRMPSNAQPCCRRRTIHVPATPPVPHVVNTAIVGKAISAAARTGTSTA